MKSVTEAILWLAIDGYTPPSRSDIDLKAMLTEIIEENKSLLNGRSIDLKIQIETADVNNTESALVHIALDNIVRNAFQHCADGDISISADSRNCVTVRNTRTCYNNCARTSDSVEETISTGGFGLGLALVHKIAERQGWQFNFELTEDEAVAKLDVSQATAKKKESTEEEITDFDITAKDPSSIC